MSKRHGNMAKNETPETEIETSDGGDAPLIDQHEAAIKKLGSRKARLYRDLRNRYQEQGDEEALAAAKSLLDEQQNLSMGDQERLFGYLEGGGKMILSEPEAMLTTAPKMPGLDHRSTSTWQRFC